VCDSGAIKIQTPLTIPSSRWGGGRLTVGPINIGRRDCHDGSDEFEIKRQSIDREHSVTSLTTSWTSLSSTIVLGTTIDSTGPCHILRQGLGSIDDDDDHPTIFNGVEVCTALVAPIVWCPHRGLRWTGLAVDVGALVVYQQEEG
jgi:hypothetical protein